MNSSAIAAPSALRSVNRRRLPAGHATGICGRAGWLAHRGSGHLSLERLVADCVAGDEQAAVDVVADVGAGGPRPPALEHVALVVAHHDQIGANVLGEGADR